jgi:hypothetical protein
MPGGRPTKYKPEYARMCVTLCALGATDEEIASTFNATVAELGQWASVNVELNRALKRLPEDILSYRQRIESVNARRRKSRAARQDASSRLLNSVRARMWAALKGGSGGRLWSRLGYGVAELKEHLQGLFTEGMTCENYGDWHIDHKKPCALFDQTDEQQFGQCWALSNLQPLWKHDNLKKSSKYAGT